MNSQDYIEIRIDIEDFNEEKAEIVEAELSELSIDMFKIDNNSLYAYMQREDFDAMKIKVVLSGLLFKCKYSSQLIPAQNWNQAWENQLDTIVIDNTVCIHPNNGKSYAKKRFNIRIEPNMAFGYGKHPTSEMMIKNILKYEDNFKGKTVLDMGSGTGILAILSAKVGAKKVYAIDIDAVATRSSYDNVAINRLKNKIECYCGDASLLQMNKYDIILANIHKNIILFDLRTYANSLKESGYIMISGFFASDNTDLIKEAQKYRLNMIDNLEQEGWSCLIFHKT